MLKLGKRDNVCFDNVDRKPLARLCRSIKLYLLPCVRRPFFIQVSPPVCWDYRRALWRILASRLVTVYHLRPHADSRSIRLEAVYNSPSLHFSVVKVHGLTFRRSRGLPTHVYFGFDCVIAFNPLFPFQRSAAGASTMVCASGYRLRWASGLFRLSVSAARVGFQCVYGFRWGLTVLACPSTDSPSEAFSGIFGICGELAPNGPPSLNRKQ